MSWHLSNFARQLCYCKDEELRNERGKHILLMATSSFSLVVSTIEGRENISFRQLFASLQTMQTALWSV